MVDDHRPLGGESSDAHEADFDTFYRVHVRPLQSMLISMGATVAEAEDVAQEAMIAVYKRWSEIKSPLAFAYVVARRALMKNQQRARTLPSRLALGGWLPEVEDQGPEEDVLGPDAILKVISRLPSRQRSVMALSFDGYTSNEIADMLRITPSSVRVHLGRARQILRTELAGIYELEIEPPTR